MNDMTRRYMDGFWELLDDMLNALLFALIGMELLLLPFNWLHVFAASLLAVAILLSRLLTVAPAILLLRRWRTVPRGTIRILTWGGLRGGVSVALARGPATGAGARSAAEHHLHRGAVVDPAAGFEHRQTGQTRDPGTTPRPRLTLTDPCR